MKQHCVSDFVDLKIFGVFILNNFFFKEGSRSFVHFFVCLHRLRACAKE